MLVSMVTTEGSSFLVSSLASSHNLLLKFCVCILPTFLELLHDNSIYTKSPFADSANVSELLPLTVLSKFVEVLFLIVLSGQVHPV